MSIKNYPLIFVAFLLGTVSGAFLHIGAQSLDGTTPLYTPVHAAKLTADIEDERSLFRWLYGDLHWTTEDLVNCRADMARYRKRPSCAVVDEDLRHGDASGFTRSYDSPCCGGRRVVEGIWMRAGSRTPKGKPLAICVDAKGSWIQAGRK